MDSEKKSVPFTVAQTVVQYSNVGWSTTTTTAKNDSSLDELPPKLDHCTTTDKDNENVLKAELKALLHKLIQ